MPWAIGGAHTMENLIALCDGHHTALHRGDVTIVGPAETAAITNVAAANANEIVHVDNRSDQTASLAASGRADAVLALTTLGFGKSEARADAAGRPRDTRRDARPTP